MSETNFNLTPAVDGSNLEDLRREAAERAIQANVNPAALTEQQHAEVEAIRALASAAILEANTAILGSPVNPIH